MSFIARMQEKSEYIIVICVFYCLMQEKKWVYNSLLWVLLLACTQKSQYKKIKKSYVSSVARMQEKRSEYIYINRFGSTILSVRCVRRFNSLGHHARHQYQLCILVLLINIPPSVTLVIFQGHIFKNSFLLPEVKTNKTVKVLEHCMPNESQATDLAKVQTLQHLIKADHVTAFLQCKLSLRE